MCWYFLKCYRHWSIIILFILSLPCSRRFRRKLKMQNDLRANAILFAKLLFVIIYLNRHFGGVTTYMLKAAIAGALTAIHFQRQPCLDYSRMMNLCHAGTNQPRYDKTHRITAYDQQSLLARGEQFVKLSIFINFEVISDSFHYTQVSLTNKFSWRLVSFERTTVLRQSCV